MQIIVGLGNPGEKYCFTRHNAGFMALDYICRQKGLSWETRKKFDSLIAKDGDRLFVKPQTFMNNSGQAVEALLSFYKLLPKKMGLIREKNSDLSKILTVIHDDLDIPLGEQKISIDSRAAGHNGVQSIIDRLKTKNFKRIRIGIKPLPTEITAGKDFVLSKFKDSELETINKIISEISI
jgi:PTH1 family peptidyl-tRNA hydrolase